LTWHTELLARFGALPFGAALEFEFARATHALHDFRRDGTKKSVGVVLPSSLTFNTGAPEIMECVGGSCEFKLKGSTEWQSSKAGEKFSVPGQSSFEIRVTEAYHYICHFG